MFAAPLAQLLVDPLIPTDVDVYLEDVFRHNVHSLIMYRGRLMIE